MLSRGYINAFSYVKNNEIEYKQVLRMNTPVRSRLALLLLCLMTAFQAIAQQTFTSSEARKLFDEKYAMVFGKEGCTLHYAVNIIGIFKTEGTIWYKEDKSKFIDERYIAWNDGITYTRLERNKKTVTLYGADDEDRDKYASKFTFVPDNYNYSAKADADKYTITLKAKKGVKGIKEAECYIDRTTGYPTGLRVKVLFFSTTIKISDFMSGGIGDDIFVFPRNLYSDYKFVDNRKK